MLQVHQADVRQNALFPHLCILQWSTPFQLCGANHLLQSARCYWKTPAGLALRNGLSDQQVVVAVGCCCCCLGSALTLASGHSVAESTGWSLAGKKSGVASRRHLIGLEKMRVKNRMRSSEITQHICTWDRTHNIISINSNKGIQRSNYRYKSGWTKTN